MRHQYNHSAFIKYFPDGRYCCSNASVVGNIKLVIQWDIEIHPDKDFLISEIVLTEITHDVDFDCRLNTGWCIMIGNYDCEFT